MTRRGLVAAATTATIPGCLTGTSGGADQQPTDFERRITLAATTDLPVDLGLDLTVAVDAPRVTRASVGCLTIVVHYRLSNQTRGR